MFGRISMAKLTNQVIRDLIRILKRCFLDFRSLGSRLSNVNFDGHFSQLFDASSDCLQSILYPLLLSVKQYHMSRLPVRDLLGDIPHFRRENNLVNEHSQQLFDRIRRPDRLVD